LYLIYKTQLYPQKPPVNLKDFELRLLKKDFCNIYILICQLLL